MSKAIIISHHRVNAEGQQGSGQLARYEIEYIKGDKGQPGSLIRQEQKLRSAPR